MLSLDGLEMIAVLVVMGLFIKVLEQFGMFEPVGGEGNGFDSEICWFDNCGFKKKTNVQILKQCVLELIFSSAVPIPSGPGWAAVLSEGLGYRCNSGPCNTLSLLHTHTHTHSYRVTLAVCEASLCPWGVCFYPLIDTTMGRMGLSAVQRHLPH